MFNIQSAPQTELNDASFPVYVGAVVGGGSIVNGMEFDRGTKADYNAWESLGNPGWGWEGLLPYFYKSSTFTPPTAELAKEFNITWDSSAYGNGPVQASYAPFFFPELPTFFSAWKELGVTKQIEGATGDAYGVFWTPSSKDPKSQTRSSARTAYYDPIAAKRPNLHLLTGHAVTGIIWDELTAQGVQMVCRTDNSKISAYATKELILAAGAIHTPQILQLSGIGPKSVLQAAHIDVRLDMPAVGANFQDHPVAYLSWNLTTDTSFPTPSTLLVNTTYNATVYNEYLVNKTGPYAGARGNSAAFLPLPQITSDWDTIVSDLVAQNASTYLPSIYSNPTLLAGFKAQKALLVAQLSSNTSSVYEFPFAGSGRATAAMQKPLSRGTITINTTNPLSAPVVNYNTIQNPTDASILVAMVKYARTFFKTRAMSVFGPVEALPGAQYVTDEQILTALKAGVLQPSFAHPSGSCAMMPQKLGGCVSPELLVYGTKRLSIIDGSIMPIIVGAHLQETMYAVAEKAADIIKARK